MSTEDRKRIRCKSCELVQFVSIKKTCVRCHQPYKQDPPKPVVAAAAAAAPPSAVEPISGNLLNIEIWTAFVLWDTRQKVGLSQKQMSERVGRFRSHVVKIESGVCSPTFETLERYCRALETSPAVVIRKAEFLLTGK